MFQGLPTVKVTQQLSCREDLDEDYSQIRELVEGRSLEMEASESESIQRGKQNDIVVILAGDLPISRT